MTGLDVNKQISERNIGKKNISIFEEVDVNSDVGVDNSHSGIQGVEEEGEEGETR